MEEARLTEAWKPKDANGTKHFFEKEDCPK